MEVTRGFHHVQLVAGDAAASLRFYADLLGLTLVQRTTGSEGAAPGAAPAQLLRLGDADATPGTLITLEVQPGGRRGRWGIGGVHHFALGVATDEAQLKWKRRLMDAGVPVSGPYDRGWFHSIYFADPDGQVVEIATIGPGYAKDEPIDRLGERIVLPDASQLRGARDERRIAAAHHATPVPEITADMTLNGLHHVTGFTDDIVRADEFYHEALGLRLVKRSVNQDDPATPHWFWANYDGTRVLPHSSYTLFEWKNSDYRARAGVGQTAHLAFRVADDDALATWEDHLQALGIGTSRRANDDGSTSIVFGAPDGQQLELASDVVAIPGSV